VSVYERLEALNIALPKLTPPVAAFVPFLRSGNLIPLSGGQGRRIPPGAYHRFCNDSSKLVRLLLISHLRSHRGRITV
jgi:hypothetical protein